MGNRTRRLVGAEGSAAAGVAAGDLKLALAIADSSGATDGPSRECAARGDPTDRV
jgi:hypothetical protein